MIYWTQRSAQSFGRGFMVMLLPAAVAWFLTFAVPPAAAEDWPMFRHDREFTASTSEQLALPLEQTWVFRSRQSQHPVELQGDQTVQFTPQRVMRSFSPALPMAV